MKLPKTLDPSIDRARLSPRGQALEALPARASLASAGELREEPHARLVVDEKYDGLIGEVDGKMLKLNTATMASRCRNMGPTIIIALYNL